MFTTFHSGNVGNVGGAVEGRGGNGFAGDGGGDGGSGGGGGGPPPPNHNTGPNTSKPKGTSRRITTAIACVECRRRKIRCDGVLPCGQCQWYQHPELCTYAKPVARTVPSRKLVEKLNSSIEQHQMIFRRLFGTKDVESLVSLPREELLNLALSKQEEPSAPIASASSSTNAGAAPGTEIDFQDSGGELVPNLDHLDEPPDSNIRITKHRFLTSAGQNSRIPHTALKVDTTAFYVGISSVNAALKVIWNAAPATRAIQIEEPEPNIDLDSIASQLGQDLYTLPDQTTIDELLTAYFEKIAPFFPMIDEDALRRDCKEGKRKDYSFMALINMVLALGSIALRDPRNADHMVFFNRACQFLGIRLDVCTVSTLEALQSLSLMAGAYLHFLARPCESDSTMGACLRIACQLGLHRQFISDTNMEIDQSGGVQLLESPVEIRRRTWWSLYCMDTWASSTTGRPSLGRSTEGVTIGEPGKDLDPNDPRHLRLLPLLHSITFCKLATRIQDRLCASSIIPSEELTQFDSDLSNWWNDLPPIMTKELEENIPSFLRVARQVIKWRYQSCRILLHRPYLLSTALKKLPFDRLSPEEKFAVSKCRTEAANIIADIVTGCKEDNVSCWMGVTLVYQAVFVPLVSLYTDFFSSEERDKWRAQVKSVLGFFKRVMPHTPMAETLKVAIWKLLEASKSVGRSSEEEEEEDGNEDVDLVGMEDMVEVVKEEIPDQEDDNQEEELPRPQTAMMLQHPDAQQYMMAGPSSQMQAPLGVVTTLAQAREILQSPISSPSTSYAASFGPTLSIHSSMIASAASQRGTVPHSPVGVHHHAHPQFAVPQATATPFGHPSRAMLLTHPMSGVGGVSGEGPAVLGPQMHHHQHHHQHHHHYHNPAVAQADGSAGQSQQQLYQQYQKQQTFWDGMVWESYPEAQQVAEAQLISPEQQQYRQTQGMMSGIFGLEQSSNEREHHDPQRQSAQSQPPQAHQGASGQGEQWQPGQGNPNWSFSS